MTRGPFRVLYIECNEDHTVGGSHQALFDLAVGLDRSRYEPVALFYQDNIFCDSLRDEGVEVVPFEARRVAEQEAFWAGGPVGKVRVRVRAIVERLKLIRTHGIDLVHLNNSPRLGHTTWLPAARLARIPCVVTAMGRIDDSGGRVQEFLARSYDRIMPISGYMTRYLEDEGIPPSKLSQVNLGIDVERVRARVRRSRTEVRHELRLAEETIVVVMVGNIRQWKGQHVALEALRAMPAPAVEGLHLLFVGATRPDHQGYLDSLQQMVTEAGLETRVTFLGARHDVPDLLQASDIALHASVMPEPFGLVIPEAMALGTPVVVANAGGPAEIITPESGIVYDPAHPEELAGHLAALAGDPKRRATLAAGARRRVEQFSIAANVAGNELVYQTVLGLPHRHHSC